ncbi:MAG: tetratricopeptide repeat-containing sensor histidine kinase [Bacteroidetes bacterium]|nr:tetratricopeptide repeat-containing sensor histidine kinase [Bacteroidota bacterium]
MRKILSYSILVLLFIFSNTNIGYGQDTYNFSKQLTFFQSKGLKPADFNQINHKIETASIRKDTVEIIKGLLDKGIISQLLSKYDKSINAYYEAIILSSKINNPGFKGNGSLGLSNSFYRLANNTKSLEYCIQAEKIFTEINDTANLITASLLMGQVLTDLGDFDQANTIYKKILTQAQHRNDSITLAEIFNQKGAMSFFQNNYEKAISYYNKSLQINKKLKNNINIGINLANIGEAHMYQGNTEKALTCLLEALEVEKKTKYQSAFPFIYYSLAQTYSLTNQDKKAIEYFDKSISVANQIGEMKEKPIIYLLLSEHYIKNRKYQNALMAYKNYVLEKDKLNDLSNRLYINELKIKYDADKKEKELLVMKTEKKLQEEKIRLNAKRIRLQNIIIALVVIILFFSIGFIVFFILNQKKLREANQTKDMLFSIIAHDLRGPMGTIKQIVHTLNDCNESQKDKFINILKRPTEKTYDLLEDLLTWSNSINKKLVNKPEVIHISSLITEIMELTAPLANEKNIQCINSIPQDLTVKADRNQLSTIIRNLVVNAIKYNHIGGKVEIFHSIVQDRVKINIKDNGVGIDPQNIKKILSTNHFFTTYGTKEEKGTGLGLILAQNFIKNHGGKLEISSELDKGSTFSFTIPLEK